MSGDERREINELENIFNLLIEEINKEKKYYEKEINNLNNNKYSEEIQKIKDKINEIKSKNENYINKDINGKLLPEKMKLLQYRIIKIIIGKNYLMIKKMKRLKMQFGIKG